MKKGSKIISFYLINLILFGALALALFIYISSYEKFSPESPFYLFGSDSPSRLIRREGRYIKYGFLFCNQLLLVSGISLLSFKHSFPVSKINNLIPFISFAEFLLMFAILEIKGIYTLYLGISTNAILITLLIFTICKTMILIKNKIIKVK